MAQLKDLIVNGSSRLIGNVFTIKLQSDCFNLFTSEEETTKSTGTSGSVIQSNGNSSYWGKTK